MTNHDHTTIDPDEYRIPTIEEIDAIRTDLGLSQRELSRRAGCEPDRFNAILRRDIDPKTSTLRGFLEALQESELQTDEELDRSGPKPERSSLVGRLEDMSPGDVGADPSPPATEGGR